MGNPLFCHVSKNFALAGHLRNWTNSGHFPSKMPPRGNICQHLCIYANFAPAWGMDYLLLNKHLDDVLIRCVQFVRFAKLTAKFTLLGGDFRVNKNYGRQKLLIKDTNVTKIIYRNFRLMSVSWTLFRGSSTQSEENTSFFLNRKGDATKTTDTHQK